MKDKTRDSLTSVGTDRKSVFIDLHVKMFEFGDIRHLKSDAPILS